MRQDMLALGYTEDELDNGLTLVKQSVTFE